MVAAAAIVCAAATDPVLLLIALSLATAGIGSMAGAFFQLPSD